MKTKFKLATLAMCLMLPVAFILTACDNHEHIMNSAWAKDEISHWHECMMDDCDVISDKSEHTFGDWIVDKEATADTEGQKHRKCSICYYYDYATIPILPSEGLEYTLNSDEESYSLSFIGTFVGTVMSVADTYEGKPVTAISDNAFSLSKYSEYADDYTDPLAGVELQKRLLNIQKIYLPDSIISIGNKAFERCSGLTEVHMGDNVQTIGNFAFLECSKLDNIVLSNSLTRISDGVFKECTSLTQINIPSNVTYIGSNAFAYAKSIKRIVLPNSDLDVYYNAFMHMYDLEYVYVGKNTHFIDSGRAYSSDFGHFNESYSIKTYEVHPDNPYYKSINGDMYSKDGKTLVAYAVGKTDTSVTIAEGVEHIGDNAFVKCKSLVSVVLPESLKTIGIETFKGCENLETITIGKNVTTIGSDAFEQTKLNTIIYTGTSAQWDNIEKGKHPDYSESDWDMGTDVVPTCLGDTTGDN